MAKHRFEKSARLLIAISIALCSTTYAKECLEYGDYTALRGLLPLSGFGYDIEVAGELAVVTRQQGGLQIIDLSTPDAMVVVSGLPLSGPVVGTTLAGDFAYVAAGESGLFVIDMADPEELALLGEVDTPGLAFDVAVAGSLGLVADYDSGLTIVDLSHPSEPILIGSIDTPGNARHVAVSGSYAFVADGTAGVQVVDFSNPTAPFIAHTVDTPATAMSVLIREDTAYISDGTSGLQILDISDPLAASIIASIDTQGFALRSKLAENTLYIADPKHGLLRYDITSPNNPIQLTPLVFPYDAQDFAFVGEHVFVVDYHFGIQAYGVNSLGPAMLAGSVDTPYSAHSIALKDDFAYIADGDRLLVADLADPVSPVIVSQLLAVDARSIEIDGSLAAVIELAQGDQRLKLVDVQDPLNPIAMGSWEAPLGADVSRIGISGTVALALDSRALWTLDVSDPMEISVLDSMILTFGVEDLLVDDTLAFVTGPWGGLAVIDFTNPQAMELLGWGASNGREQNMARSGDYIIATEYLGDNIFVFDISNLESPTFISQLDAPRFATSVEIADGFAYFACDDEGLMIYELSDPTNPWLIGLLDTPGTAKQIAVGSGYVYIADGLSGVQIAWRPCDELTGVLDPHDPIAIPILQQNFPNPFNPTTIIPFTLERAERVTLNVYDMSGRLVRKLISNEERGLGYQEAVWDGLADNGRRAASGIYLYRLEAGAMQSSNRMVLLK